MILLLIWEVRQEHYSRLTVQLIEVSWHNNTISLVHLPTHLRRKAVASFDLVDANGLELGTTLLTAESVASRCPCNDGRYTVDMRLSMNRPCLRLTNAMMTATLD